MIARQLTTEEMVALINKLTEEKESAVELLRFACPEISFNESLPIDKLLSSFIAYQFGKNRG